jgi:hypothetical protein
MAPKFIEGMKDRLNGARERGRQTREARIEVDTANRHQMHEVRQEVTSLAHETLLEDIHARQGLGAELVKAEQARLLESMKHGETSLAYKLGERGVGGLALDATKGTYGKIKGAGKWVRNKGFWVGGAVAGAGALWMLARSFRGDRAKASREELQNPPVNDIPQVMGAPDMMSQQTMMGMQPVAGDHAARVMAGRGMAPSMAAAAVNPTMNVGPEADDLAPRRI